MASTFAPALALARSWQESPAASAALPTLSARAGLASDVLAVGVDWPGRPRDMLLRPLTSRPRAEGTPPEKGVCGQGAFARSSPPTAERINARDARDHAANALASQGQCFLPISLVSRGL